MKDLALIALVVLIGVKAQGNGEAKRRVITDPCAGHECCDDRVAFFDLQKGRATLGPEGIELMERLGKPSGNKECDIAGKISVNFEAFTEKPCNACMSTPFFGRRMLKVEFDLHPNTRDGWLFNIGDSKSNNGYGGDGGNQAYDAETDGIYPHITTFTNDVCKEENGMPNQFNQFFNALGPQVSKVTMFIANSYVRVVSGNTDQYVCSKCLYALNNQYDNNGVSGGKDRSDRNIYISFNSVVAGGRYGNGLCAAKVSWVCPRARRVL